jgi:hypothetical protein
VRSIFEASEHGDWSSLEWAHPEIEYRVADGPQRDGLAEMAEGMRYFLSGLEGERMDPRTSWGRSGRDGVTEGGARALREHERSKDARCLVRSIFAAWGRGDYSSTGWADSEIECVLLDGPDSGVVGEESPAWGRRGAAG